MLWVIYQYQALPHTTEEAWLHSVLMPQVQRECGFAYGGDFQTVTFKRLVSRVHHFINGWAFETGLLIRPAGTGVATWNPDVVARWFTNPEGVEAWLRSTGRVDPWMKEDTSFSVAIDTIARELEGMCLEKVDDGTNTRYVGQGERATQHTV